MPTTNHQQLKALVAAIRRRLLVDPAPGAPDSGASLAARLESAGRQAARRLEDCLQAQSAGDLAKALALAAEPPALTRVVELLDFDGAADWRELCRARRWAVAPDLDAGMVGRLAALHAEETLDEQAAVLRDQLRVAMLTRDHKRALEVARELARLLPDDAAVAERRKSLEALVAQSSTAELRSLLAEERAEDVVALVDRMDELGIPAAPADAERAREMRRRLEADEVNELSRALLARLDSLVASDDWMSCEPVLAELDRIEPSCGAAWSAYQRRLIARSRALVEKGRGEAVRREARDESLRRLQAALHAADGDLRRRPLPRARAEAAETALREAAEGARAHGELLPGDVAERTQAMLGRLAAVRELARRRRRLARAAFAAAALAAIAAAGALAFRSLRAAQTAGEIERLVDARLEEPVRRLLDGLQDEGRRPGGPARLTAAATAAGDWLRHVEAGKDAARGLLRRIEAQAASDFDGTPAHEVVREWSAFEAVAAGLSRESADALAREAAPLKSRLDQWLAVRRDEAAGLAVETLRQLEEIESNIARGLAAADLRAAVHRAEEILQPLRPWMDTAAPQLQLPDTTRTALADAAARVRTSRETLDTLDAAMRGLREAGTVPDYAAALARVAAVPLAGAREVGAAAALPPAKLDQRALLGAMLLPGDPALWATLRTDADFARKLQPDDALQGEIDALDRLARNPFLADIREVTVSPRARTIYLRGQPIMDRKPDTRTRKLALEIHDPKVSPRAEFKTVQVDPNMLAYGKGEFLAEDRISRASHVLDSLKLEQMTDPERQGFRKGILETADLVLAWRDNMPPEVAAYLLQALWAMGNEPPDKGPLRWGLGWSPGYMADMEQLRRTLPPLDGSEWMNPSDESIAAAMRQLFESRAPVSYARQAVLHQRLAAEAVRSGLVLRGFVEADGVPRLSGRDAGKPQTLWGFEDGTLAFKPLLRADPARSGAPVLLATPAPLTPLVAGRGDADRAVDAAMSAAGIRAEDRTAYLTQLPPLFAPPPAAPGP